MAFCLPDGMAMRLATSSWRVAALGIAATLLVAGVVLASRPAPVAGGDGPANAGPVIALLHLIEIAGLAVELFAFLVLLLILRYFRRQEQEPEEELYQEPRRLPWALRLLLVALPLLQIAAIMYAITRIGGETPEAMPALPASPPGGPVERFFTQVGASLGLAWWEVAVSVVLAVAAFIALVRVLRAPRPITHAEPEEPRPAQVLATAVAAGLRDARGEPDPRRAVIAAYATLEAMLAAQGFPRRAVEAPLEYMARLFGELELNAEALRTLTDLFELARFSPHDITPATKARAIGALTALERDLQPAT